jgi:hypothetical protein
MVKAPAWPKWVPERAEKQGHMRREQNERRKDNALRQGCPQRTTRAHVAHTRRAHSFPYALLPHCTGAAPCGVAEHHLVVPAAGRAVACRSPSSPVAALLDPPTRDIPGGYVTRGGAATRKRAVARRGGWKAIVAIMLATLMYDPFPPTSLPSAACSRRTLP